MRFSFCNFCIYVPVDVTSSFNYKECKSIIKKKKKKHDKILLLGKDELNAIEVLISKGLIDSYVSHDKCFSVNNVLR